MSPEVDAAIIAGIVALISLGPTTAVAIIGIRKTRENTQDSIKAQHDQLKETLAEQYVRTLNERFATATDSK